MKPISLLSLGFLFTCCASQTIINNEKRLVCQLTSPTQFNVTLKDGMRNKQVRYLGRRVTWNECSEAVCGVRTADFAFMLSHLCYAVTCLKKCEVIDDMPREQTRLVGISRSSFMSHEHRIIKDIFRDLMNKDIRPRLEFNTKIRVLLNIRLVQLFDVDAVGQTIKLNVWTTQEWTNPLLGWQREDYGNISIVNVEPNLVWTPVLMLYNNADNKMTSLKASNTKVIVNSSGHSTWFAATSMKASCKINVKYFPFDQQLCHLKFGSWTKSINQMEIIPFKTETGLQHFTQNAEWEVVKFSAEKRMVRYECCKEPFTEVVYHLHLRRKTLYYIYTLVLPVTTITSLIALGFCLPPNSGERIILSVTILVSMTVYLNIAGRKLPATSKNIPLLSLFYFLLFIQICFSLAASTFVLANFYRQNFSKPMPEWFRWLIFENLSKLLCGQKISTKRPLRFGTAQGGKTVRFSDFITVNGSLASEASRCSRISSNGTHKKSSDKPLEEHLRVPLFHSRDKENNETDSTLLNGSFCNTTSASLQSEDTLFSSPTETINMFENIFGTRLAEKAERRQAKLINKEIEVLTHDVYEKEKKKEMINEWQYASMVIDRAFLIIFISTLTISISFFLLHKIPHLTDNSM